MSNNRELSQFAKFTTIDESGNNNVGIATTVRISPGGLYVDGVEVIGPGGAWKGPNSGLVGAQGAQGAQGYQGVQGEVGAQGAQGSDGAQGAQGDVGAQGTQGAPGAQGNQGYQGRQGAPGPQGAQGAQGATGATSPPSGTDIQLTDGFFTNDQQLNSNKTLSGTLNGGVFGPYSIASGITLTISSGATFTVI